MRRPACSTPRLRAASWIGVLVLVACSSPPRNTTPVPPPFDPQRIQPQPVNVRISIARTEPMILGTAVALAPTPILMWSSSIGLTAAEMGINHAERSRRESAAEEALQILQAGTGDLQPGQTILDSLAAAAQQSTWAVPGRRERVLGYQPIVSFDTVDAPFVSVSTDLGLTRDGEILVVQALVSFTRRGERTPAWQRLYLYCSAPIAPDAAMREAMMAWVADDATALRRVSEEAGLELAHILKEDFFSPDSSPTERERIRIGVKDTNGRTHAFAVDLVEHRPDGRMIVREEAGGLDSIPSSFVLERDVTPTRSPGQRGRYR